MAGQPTGTVVDIYTDGACSGNPGPGGWGAVLCYGAHVKELYGGQPQPTTNNRMELMAAIAALESLTRPVTVRLHTDSAYVRDGITKWQVNWNERRRPAGGGGLHGGSAGAAEQFGGVGHGGGDGTDEHGRYHDEQQHVDRVARVLAPRRMPRRRRYSSSSISPWATVRRGSPRPGCAVRPARAPLARIGRGSGPARRCRR